MPERSDADTDRPDNDRPNNDRLDKDRPENDRPDNHRPDKDRRRTQRFSCSGHAKITHLPSNGIFVPGTIRDLSLGGCSVDTTVPIDSGVRTEIVVRVNAASFRAVGEVKAIRGGSTACMEFVRLSAGGKDLLEDLVAELARLQAIVNKLRAARQGMDAKSFRRELEAGKLQAVRFSERFPFLGTILSAEISEQDQAASIGKDRVVEAHPLVIPVDLFG